MTGLPEVTPETTAWDDSTLEQRLNPSLQESDNINSKVIASFSLLPLFFSFSISLNMNLPLRPGERLINHKLLFKHGNLFLAKAMLDFHPYCLQLHRHLRVAPGRNISQGVVFVRVAFCRHPPSFFSSDFGHKISSVYNTLIWSSDTTPCG